MRPTPSDCRHRTYPGRRSNLDARFRTLAVRLLLGLGLFQRDDLKAGCSIASVTIDLTCIRITTGPRDPSLGLEAISSERGPQLLVGDFNCPQVACGTLAEKSKFMADFDKTRAHAFAYGWRMPHRYSCLFRSLLKVTELVPPAVREFVKYNSVLGPLVTHSTERYRPELHYMRGPGPKWFERHSDRTDQWVFVDWECRAPRIQIFLNKSTLRYYATNFWPLCRMWRRRSRALSWGHSS